ncbi:inosine guanosine and [Dichomitus squalens]|uniref:Purine nucleoside phosphorylase n=1 Tax=Dichomitus squalens (strain LYAD-421) TaxID=732165 RepID=R7SVQ9_DICSQ|nr:inosine guanosine and [Dichomitus squalens LYAD-421 SS1]EJF59850.1 inosine guanosine and [Dichomitus squalens LYAD-421 SS1]TBU39344.1 inosine guanosine and [Dichomitus squalens]
MPRPDSEQSRSDALPFEQTMATLHSLLPEKLRRPHVGIVCGSGLHTLAAAIRDVVEVPYATLPGFGKSTVPGHKSSLAFGLIGPGEGVPVVAMLGRLHPYEGHKLSAVVYPIRVMARLGIRNLIITNAAGALNPDIDVGTIVVIQDHLAFPNLTGMNPLLGPQLDPKYPRFLALSSAYSVSLRRYAFLAAHKLQLGLDALAEGVYAWVSGPTYETPAEGRMLRNAGADVVGMSTIPEVVAGKEEGLEVLVLSLVTNKVVIPTRYRSIREEVEAELAGKPVVRQDEPQVSHEEVLLIGKQKAEVMKSLVEKIVELIASEPSSASPASA